MKTEDPDRGMRQHFGRHGKTCGWVVVFKVIKKGSWVITGKDHGLQLGGDWQ